MLELVVGLDALVVVLLQLVDLVGEGEAIRLEDLTDSLDDQEGSLVQILDPEQVDLLIEHHGQLSLVPDQLALPYHRI